MREIVEPGCITIQEFLITYLIQNDKYNFSVHFPTILALLTSYNDIFLYTSTELLIIKKSSTTTKDTKK